MRALAVDRSSDVWRLVLNRPERGNAIDAAMVRTFDELLDEAQSCRIRGLLIQAEGRHFCTGLDLGALGEESDDSLLARFVRIELLLQRIARAPFVTAAVARGRAIGAGADLFAACQLRLALKTATFAFPGASGFGLVLGTRRLSQRVGATTALTWAQTGRTIDAEEARRCGLVECLDDDAAALARSIDGRLRAASVAASLRAAVEPNAAIDDARDLERLVRSAAARGLRDRIAAYAERLPRPLPILNREDES